MVRYTRIQRAPRGRQTVRERIVFGVKDAPKNNFRSSPATFSKGSCDFTGRHHENVKHFRRSLRFLKFCLASDLAHYASTVTASLVDLFPSPHHLVPSSFSRASRSSIFAAGLSARRFLSSPVRRSSLPPSQCALPRDFGVTVRVHYRELTRSEARFLSVAAYLHSVDDVFAGN